MTAAIERFPALDALGERIQHGFVGRIPGLDMDLDREAALARLSDIHRTARADLGLADAAFVTAKQVHGSSIAVIPRDALAPTEPIDEVDALITNQAGVCLGIFVADCAAVYLYDPKNAIIALAHSGKKGTELGIVRETIWQMERMGSDPADIVGQIGPSIRPPNYEIDFTAAIVEQCRKAGVEQIHDCGVDTHADPERYYSYRREKGRTGRMLALLALR
jgi:copper oxidase (laccase) domain-containing protein